MSTIESSSSSNNLGNVQLPQQCLDGKDPRALLARFGWKLEKVTNGKYIYSQKNYHPFFGPVNNKFSTPLGPLEFYLERLAEHERMKNIPDPWIEYAKENKIQMPIGRH